MATARAEAAMPRRLPRDRLARHPRAPGHRQRSPIGAPAGGRRRSPQAGGHEI